MSLPVSASGSADAGLLPGFTEPVFDAQTVFRAAMRATAYPGRVVPLGRELTAPVPFNRATAALCLTLLDLETPLWADPGARAPTPRRWLSFHCGVPLVDQERRARFAISTDPATLPRFIDFHPGDVEYPDRSTTLIVQVPSLTDGRATSWTGPGIKGSIAVRIAGLPDWFWPEWELNGELYPLGIDVFFTCDNALIGLPRTIRVEA
ncbi:phosphonate C-P lyase system protein PhnH [Chelatococcus sp. GCM10030263]|uniref:phosphonate C-P lyase system protein PhnH n=1 Tax=Chelatococcus sp. GCM10030263 TaxID=3273387 RepID=UPI00361750F1